MKNLKNRKNMKERVREFEQERESKRGNGFLDPFRIAYKSLNRQNHNKLIYPRGQEE